MTVSGTGAGTVSWTNDGVTQTCTSGNCFAAVPHGTAVTLTAAATSGTFAGWGGDCSSNGTALTCAITLDGSKSVIAAFTSTGNIPLAVTTVGLGTVTSDVGGISCGSNNGNKATACAAEYASASVVNLTATADLGQTFQGWSGACTGTGACSVTLNSVQNVTALFTGTMLRMDVVLTGAGKGRVVSSPAGVACGAFQYPDAGATCGAPFTPGTVVTLTATPKDSSSMFSGWTGACQGAATTCTVTLDGNKSAAANFVRALGNILVAQATEPAGANCTYGGIKVTAGMDANSNGTLDSTEVGSTNYACNSSTQTAAVSTSLEPAGANCLYGGTRIDSTIDPSFTIYECNASPGLPSATTGLNATITSITPSTVSGPISVRFKLKDDLGNPISKDGTYSQNKTITPRFALAYYTKDGNNNFSPYTVYTVSLSHGVWAPTALTASTGGKLVENGMNAGDYTYIFPSVDTSSVKGVQYDGTKTSEAHVVWIEATRQTDLVNTTNGASFYVVNQPYYFIPATGAPAAAREIVKKENCWKCHDTKFKVESTTTAEGVFHGGSRIDPTYCNVCHNPARTSNVWANSKSHIHRIHNAEGLQPTNVFDATGAFAFPQTTANCAACHGGAAQGAQAQNVPTQRACGSCHDNVNFTTTLVGSLCQNPRAMTVATGITTDVPLTFAASTDAGSGLPLTPMTVSRPATTADGGAATFVTDGFKVGDAVAISGTASNNVHMQVSALSTDGLTMTLVGSMATVAEVSPASAHINAYSIPTLCDHVGDSAHSSSSPQADDTQCATCHTAAEINTRHQPVAAPDPTFVWLGGTNNYSTSAWVAASGQVPAGASVFTYDLQSIGTWTDGSGNVRPMAVFRILKDGVRADFQTFNLAGGQTELYAGFMGSPSAYFAWAMPRDGVAAPSEFNASTSCFIRNAWNGKAASTCTLSGPDSNGYYTVKMVGGTPIATGATMLTGGIGYTYGSTPPLTQINLSAYPTANPGGTLNGMTCKASLTTDATYGNYVCGGLIVPTPDVWMTAPGFNARRAIVDNEKCKNCHGALGIQPNFHVGQRNNAPTCSFCHTADKTSNAWSANSRYYIHAIHGGRVRSVNFMWEAGSPGPGYGEVEYPSPLNDCQTCHLPGTNKLVNANANMAATVATGTYPATPSFAYSPYITIGANYGTGYSVSSTTGVQTEATGNTLVISPIATVCTACHDTQNAIDHMRGKGARFYEPRSTYLADVTGGTTEQCNSCHAQLNH